MSIANYGTSTEEVKSTQLHTGEEIALRNEVMIPNEHHGSLNRVVTVGWAVQAFLRWYEETLDTWAVFENEEGERKEVPLGNRFMPDSWRKRYAKFNDLERGIREDYGGRSTQAMITLTGSTTYADGSPRPPVDHFLDLMESWNAVTTALDRCIPDHAEYERIALPEAHESGHIHWHIAVYVDTRMDAEDFKPVLDSHVRNCKIAGRDAHTVGEAVECMPLSSVDNISSYLAAYMGGEYEGDPREMPEHVQIMLATLWATEKQMWRPSNGAQDYMAYDPEDRYENAEWELVGVKYGEDGEVVPVDPEAAPPPHRKLPVGNSGLDPPS
ncbi:hypothetical protein [Haloarcula sp. H-GB5]